MQKGLCAFTAALASCAVDPGGRYWGFRICWYLSKQCYIDLELFSDTRI